MADHSRIGEVPVTSPSVANSPATGAPSPVRDNTDHASFEDDTGHVIGAWVKDRSLSGDAGVLAYVYVESVDGVLKRVSARSGQAVRAPYMEGDLRVATFRDPFGSVIGVWQRAST